MGNDTKFWSKNLVKRRLGTLGCIKDNIKPDIKEIGYEWVDCINLAQNRNQWRISVLSGSINNGEFSTSLATIILSKRTLIRRVSSEGYEHL
jgi:hypothetical protein